MPSQKTIVLGFKSKFLTFLAVDDAQKETVLQSFETVVGSIPERERFEIARYIELFNQAVTDAEKIYFSKKAFELLAPFFAK